MPARMLNRVLIRDARLRTLFALSLAILLFTAAAVYVGIGSVRDPLITHFDAYRGIDAIGVRTDLFLIPATGIIVLFLNMALAAALYFRERFASQLIAFASLGLSLLILIASFVIMSVN